MAKSKYVFASKESLFSLRELDLKLKFDCKLDLDSLLQGNYISKKRGQSLHFNEIREYVYGDDIRFIDWKSSLRTDKTQITTYFKEKDKSVFFVADQSEYMRFGSNKYLKSVTVANIISLLFWHYLGKGDRVGGIIFNNETFEEFESNNNRLSSCRFIEKLSDYNLRLLNDSIKNKICINDILKKICDSNITGKYIVISSNILELDDDSISILKEISNKNQFIFINVYDDIEKELPQCDLNIESNSTIYNIPSVFKKLRKTYKKEYQDELDNKVILLKQLRINIINLRSNENLINQLIEQFKGE